MHAANFTVFGFYLPFFPVWLDGIGLGKTEIGLLLALPILVRIVAAPPISGLADHRFQPGLLLALLNTLVLLGYGLLWPLSGFWPVMAVMLLLAVGQCAIIPVADALTNAHVQAGGGVDYGRVRVWGSVSFLLTTLLGGWVIKLAGPGIVPPALAACALLAAGVALLAPPRPVVARAAPPPNTHHGTGSAPGVAPEAERRRRLAFVCLLAASAMVQACHGALYAFGTLYWQGAGHGDVAIGGLWAVGVAAEIVLFAYAGRLGMRGEIGLRWIMIGALAALLRFAAMPFVTGLLPSFALQMLHALSFGLTHLGAMAAITWLAPEHARGRSQGLLTSAHAIAIAATTVLAGVLYERIGGLTFLAMGPLALIGLACAIAADRLAAAPGRPGPA